MESNYDLIQVVQYCLKVISLLYSTLLIYCSIKVQPINKPPGSLVLFELIFIYLIQLIGLANSITLYLYEPKSISNMLLTLIAIRLYLITTNSHYEICIIFELYLRLRVKKSNQPFRKRVIIYHAASHFLAICITAITMAAFTTIVVRDGDYDGMIDYNLWVLWFTISYFTLNLVTFVIIAGMTAYKNSKLFDSSVKRFIDKLIKYIIVLVIVRVIYLALLISESIVIKNLYDEQDRILANNYFSSLFFVTNMIPYIFRMFDPHIKEFLKYRVKSIKYRIKDKMNYMICRRPYTYTINQTLIPVRKLFDDILIENIEYRLIALTIAMLKSPENYDEV
jgi:hypothetical protein